MSDTATAALPPAEPERVSRALSARAAVLAQRVAGLLEATCREESGAPAATAFLRGWAEFAAEPAAGRPPEPDPFGHLLARLGIGPVERDLLLLAGLPEEHEGLAVTFRTLHPRGDSYASVGLAALLLERAPAGTVPGASTPDRAGLRRLLHEGAAVRSGALALAGEGPFHERSLVLADQLWEALHGYDAWPAALAEVVLGPVAAGLEGWLALPESERAVRALRSGEPRTLLVTARDEAVGLSRCAALAQAAGLRPVAGRARPDDPVAVGLLGLHAVARGGVPVLVAPPAADGVGAAPLEVRRIGGPLLVCAEPGAVRPGADRPVLTVPLGPIGSADRRTAWRAALPDATAQAPELAARHPLDPALTAQVALDVHSLKALAARADVPGAIRARAGAVLPAGVDLATPQAGWDRLVLAGEAGDQLRDAVARLEHQALVLDEWRLRESARADRGVRLLFTGPPGTGKSLAAEVVATAAGTDLLVVDVSRVVSKWIGETEKNLAAAFDVAERTRAVLLLDEADALFGTRTEISDAHDRYANLETAYLLQRLDSFDGLAVLATNLRQNIDPAFVRRMDFVVEFESPGEESRRELWHLHLPPALRGGDVDLADLARRYPVPGGWIRNAAIAAAFRAAASGGPVRREHLAGAMRREYAKAARPFPGDPGGGRGEDMDQRAVRALDPAAPTTRTQEETP